MDDYDDDFYDAEEAEMYQDLQFLQDNRPFRPNMRRRVEQRFDPFDLSPREFYQRYRFSKESVQDRLIPLLYPDGVRALDDRGHPFTPEQVVCSALHMLGGNTFYRTEGVCNRSSKATVFRHLTELVDRLQVIKPLALHMPTPDMMDANRRAIVTKYYLNNVIAGVDGMFVPMTNLRNIPEGHYQLLYFNRKVYPALNTLVLAGYDHRIYDIVINAPGSFHDSTVYNLSQMKPYLENLVPRVQVLGDSAFALNDTIITPYNRNQAREFPTKALFNIRHSAARVEMTEDTFGIFKRRFPILRDMRYGLQRAMRVIESCAVLHNLAIRWGDILPRYMFEDVWEEPQLIVNNVVVNPNVAVQYDVPRAVRFQQGLVQREHMMRVCCNLAAPSQREMNKIGLLRQRQVQQPIVPQNAPQP